MLVAFAFENQPTGENGIKKASNRCHPGNNESVTTQNTNPRLFLACQNAGERRD